MVVVGTSTEACGKVYGICTCPVCAFCCKIKSKLITHSTICWSLVISLDWFVNKSHIHTQGLFHICTRGHDNGYFRMVLKGLLQTLNMSWISSLNSRSSTLSGNNFTKKHLNIRDTALKFLHHVRNTLGETSLTLFRVLAQHLCSSIPDRTPARTQGAEVYNLIPHLLETMHLFHLIFSFSSFTHVVSVLTTVLFV